MASEMVKTTKFMELVEQSNFEHELKKQKLIEIFKVLDEANNRFTLQQPMLVPLEISLSTGIKTEPIYIVQLSAETGQVRAIDAKDKDEYEENSFVNVSATDFYVVDVITIKHIRSKP